MRELPAGLAQAFHLAVAELGMCSASWLFVEEVAREGGLDLLLSLRDQLGRAFPVLDAVVAARLEGALGPDVDPRPVLDVCAGAARIVTVGIETRFLDALVRALPETRFSLLRQSVFSPDWERVIANYAGRVELETLDTFQRFAGPRSVLLTWVYGGQGSSTHVLPAWVRASGEDVRTQFGSLVGWDVLSRPFYVYPRWLVEVPAASFTHVVGPP